MFDSTTSSQETTATATTDTGGCVGNRRRVLTTASTIAMSAVLTAMLFMTGCSPTNSDSSDEALTTNDAALIQEQDEQEDAPTTPTVEDDGEKRIDDSNEKSNVVAVPGEIPEWFADEVAQRISDEFLDKGTKSVNMEVAIPQDSNEISYVMGDEDVLSVTVPVYVESEAADGVINISESSPEALSASSQKLTEMVAGSLNNMGHAANAEGTIITID